MQRTINPDTQSLIDEWSPAIVEYLGNLGERTWPLKKIRHKPFKKPEIVVRHLVEGPEQRGEKIMWAVSHTLMPSSFSPSGILEEGQRAYWLITLEVAVPVRFTITGNEEITGILELQALEAAFKQAKESGPLVESFYGNKGPLSHTKNV